MRKKINLINHLESRDIDSLKEEAQLEALLTCIRCALILLLLTAAPSALAQWVSSEPSEDKETLDERRRAAACVVKQVDPFPLLSRLLPKPDDMPDKIDPFKELGKEQPALWDCGSPEKSTSVLYIMAEAVEGALSAKVKAERGHRLDKLPFIEAKMKNYRIFAEGQDSSSELARKYSKEYRKLKAIYRVIQQSSEANLQRWQKLHEKMAGNRIEGSQGILSKVEEVVKSSKRIGQSRNRCATPLEALSDMASSRLKAALTIPDDPNKPFEEYDVLPEDFQPYPYDCYAEYPENAPDDTIGPPIVEYVKYLQKKVEELLQAAIQRNDKYVLAGAKAAADPDEIKKASRLNRIASGMDPNDELILKLKSLLDDILELKKGIIKASNTETLMAQLIQRCRPMDKFESAKYNNNAEGIANEFLKRFNQERNLNYTEFGKQDDGNIIVWVTGSNEREAQSAAFRQISDAGIKKTEIKTYKKYAEMANCQTVFVMFGTPKPKPKSK